MNNIVAIHQPNFFPWLGYFDKIVRSDVFLFMDNAQFPKKGGTWLNRVKLIVGGKPEWISMPVDRSYHGFLPISEMKTNNKVSWRTKTLKTIMMNYKRSPYYSSIFPYLEEYINNPNDNLASYNMENIKSIMKMLNLDTNKLVAGSTLDVSGTATDLLINMVRAVNGTAYMCGGGATGYQEDEKFVLVGYDLIYQDYQHPVYNQINSDSFVPGLSIIDALMNCGFDGVAKILKVRNEI